MRWQLPALFCLTTRARSALSDGGALDLFRNVRRHIISEMAIPPEVFQGFPRLPRRHILRSPGGQDTTPELCRAE
jgi:hypothetical protein